MTPLARSLAAHPTSFATIERYLQQEEVIILPMATVYSFVVNGTSPRAIANLRRLKHFSTEQPLAILTRSDRAAEVAELSRDAKTMVDHFPYPVTMIVKGKPHLDPQIMQGFNCVYLACPDQFIYDLVGALPFFLVAATVKVGTELIVNFEDAQKYYGEQPLIVDGGRCRYGRRGTLVDFTLAYPTIMNFGPVSVDDLRPILPHIILPSHLMK
ncbi:Sua5/YciO/YrdC/YwlC family protein [Thermosynechococcus sp. GLH187]|uniref:L-threonylcarbamoyladenylate synthase n=1 Tax=unclassified Thermosynechococcus TaxID=2622553 RepID=UPI002877497A|nr:MULTISPECIES: Sua5/YciO/YrdC/YwlC family protein [unclassified Thermosynechococcus]WNC45940.1 Sua5/YciO/YrdC/YwlC family protein [Thermosynechococcus sp. GLH187]WNC48476.1 Sua5/YciO/YrdC/YwlC family protein [Thermosynechococcus sp. GLH333]WNC51009.1 Sua5/YciO/YrdC/YwlC family protein [Thermosynechococcus sp. GLH87]